MIALSFTAAYGLAALAAAQASAVPDCTGTPSATRLMVRVENVKSSNGLIAVSLYADIPGKFLRKRGALYVGRVPARKGTTEACIHVPRPGVWAVAVYHDEDSDRGFDRTGIGLPAEGFGFSGNPPTFLGMPNFARVRFSVPRSGVRTTVRLKYR